MMTNWFDVSNTAEAGAIPESVKLSFYAGGLIFLAAVSWTVFRTNEYSPEEMASFFDESPDDNSEASPSNSSDQSFMKGGLLWLVVGVVGTLVIDQFSDVLDRNLYILSLGIATFGLCQIAASMLVRKVRPSTASLSYSLTSLTCRDLCGSSPPFSSSAGFRCSQCGHPQRQP